MFFTFSTRCSVKRICQEMGTKVTWEPMESHGWNSFCYTALPQFKYYIQSFVFPESFIQNIDRAYLFNRRTSKISPLGLQSEIINVWNGLLPLFWQELSQIYENLIAIKAVTPLRDPGCCFFYSIGCFHVLGSVCATLGHKDLHFRHTPLGKV